MSDIDENSDRRLSDTSEKYEGTEHYTLVKTKDGWHIVCGDLVSDMTLFELAVTYALVVDESGQIREWMRAHRVKRALLPDGAPQGEEPDPLL